MFSTQNPEINVEELMRRIREEVAQRKAQLHAAEVHSAEVHTAPPNPAEEQAPWVPLVQSVPVLPRLPHSTATISPKSEYSLAEFLNFDDDVFVRSAYAGILRREPDPAGEAHYLQLLRTQQMSKAEVLGRMRYSPEGRACAAVVHGLFLPFAVQSSYRIPILGYGIALANFLLRLPVIIRNRVSFESHTLKQQREQAAQINAMAAQLESAIGLVQQGLVDCGEQINQRIRDRQTLALAVDRLSNELSDKAGNSKVIALESQLEAARAMAASRQDVDALHQSLGNLAHKADQSFVKALVESIEQKAAVAQIEAMAAQSALQAELAAVRSRAAPREEVDTLQQQVRDLSSKADTAFVQALVDALAHKAPITQLEALAANTGERLQTLSDAVSTKAGLDQVEALSQTLAGALAEQATLAAQAVQAQEGLESLSDAVSTKAGLDQVEALSQTLAGALAEQATLAAQAVQSQEGLESLSDVVSTKAGLDQVEALSQTLAGALAEQATLAAQAVQAQEELESMSDAVSTKAGLDQVESLNLQMGEKVLRLIKALELKADNERLTQLTNYLGEVIERKADATDTLLQAKEMQRQIQDHKHNILDQHRRLAMLLEEARKRLPAPISTEQIENMVAEEDHLLDALYVSFEDRFRGTREDIKQRVAIYLPIVKEAKVGTQAAPILDVGCGRGEWLQLLGENGHVARGIDLNRVMVSQCQELGLEVVEADAIAYLRNLKPNSLGAVTGMHIIEHIPFKRLIALFDEVLRVLKPGGVAIFETPNPENVTVGACSFYYDPTHLNPLPPEPMRFVMDARGYGRIDIMRLHPKSELATLKEGVPQVQQIVNGLMFGPQDYALVAFKS